MDGWDDDSQGFLLSAYCCIPFQHLLAHINRPKVLARDEVYRYQYFSEQSG
jgi:hypothetical protein